MTNDNIAEFPTSASLPEQQPELAPQPNILQIVEKNRKEGLELLQEKVEALSTKKRGIVNNTKTESRLRDIERALGAGLTAIEAINTLLEIVKHDLVACIKNVEGLGKDSFTTASHMETLTILLKEKTDFITDKELERVWNEVIPGRIQKMKEAFENASQEAKSE